MSRTRTRLIRCIRTIAILAVFIPVPSSYARAQAEPGLLFRVTADSGFSADYAAGSAEPTFLANIEIIPDGALGQALRVPNFTQALAWDAHGNIRARRGTVAFFWRSREPLGPTPFHVFQVSYFDHSSIDMAWMRIDYNGAGGFDAFVTDRNLARVRVSHTSDRPPAPDAWTHISFAWDETIGVRLYLDGVPAGSVDTRGVWDAGLDQFGAHNRFINAQHMTSNYNHTRGGDLDELVIYDRMLAPEQIAALTRGEQPRLAGPPPSYAADPALRTAFDARYGWDDPAAGPPLLDAPATIFRKVEIHDVFDLKQWVWKGTDGIRETTWPYVYNRSRLPGRLDYFIEPDWNCYSGSGKTVVFTMPEERWNYLEIAGSAHGSLDRIFRDNDAAAFREESLGGRPAGRERTFHLLPESVRGGDVRFTNDLREEPIGEFSAFLVEPGSAPGGTARLTYTIDPSASADQPCLEELRGFIRGRYPSEEAVTIPALPAGAPRNQSPVPSGPAAPVVHILIPEDFRDKQPAWTTNGYSYSWRHMNGGLDGIELSLPALDLPVTGGGIPLNIMVRDPLWPARALLDVTVSVPPGAARTLWLDTRDRLLPPDRSLCVTIAAGSSGFSAKSLEGATLTLVFTDRETALAEHTADRITQVVDNYGNIVECHPTLRKFRLYDRFLRDVGDILRVDPDHALARAYWALDHGEQGWPTVTLPEPPPGVPLWAFRQTENMRQVEHFLRWWIDNRQIENGEFGGGLSDDGDMTNQWPGPALMGIAPDVLTGSVLREMEAFYENGMFADGLPTIVTDELHVYEEGINVIPQCMLLDYGDPKVVERLLATARAYERITGINDRGRRQLMTAYFSGTEIHTDSVWGTARTPLAYLVFHDGMALVEFNGHPAAKRLLLELADGLLAEVSYNDRGRPTLPENIWWPSGEGSGSADPGTVYHLFWACWRWTGDERYLAPIIAAGPGIAGSLNANVIDRLGRRDTWGRDLAAPVTPHNGADLSRHIAWQVSGDTAFLDGLYADQVRQFIQRMPLYTEGHWWTDRVHGESPELQRARLGGVALVRSAIYPGHTVSWRFRKPFRGDSVAIAVREATADKLVIVAYNLETEPVTADMTGWDIDPGTWELTQGADSDGDGVADSDVTTSRILWERTVSHTVTFPPRETTVLTLSLKRKGTPYWNRPDLGIGEDDVSVRNGRVEVIVHSLGQVNAPGGRIVLAEPGGSVIAQTSVPPLMGLTGYEPVTASASLDAPAGRDLSGCVVRLDMDGATPEITRLNNTVTIR